MAPQDADTIVADDDMIDDDDTETDDDDDSDEPAWHYFDGAGQHGPVSAAELLQRGSEGLALGAAVTLFWKEGLDGWRPLQELPELRAELEAGARA